MIEREKYENALFNVRFYGEDLKNRGVSIYDLSHSLLAIQRIFHKAHLSINNKLQKGAYPDVEDRKMLALQISERRKGSDAFGLMPILSDLATLEYLKTLSSYIISAVVAYYTRDVLDEIRGEKDKNKQIFIGSIYTEVVNIATRVDASGGVEGISLGAPALNRGTIANFDSDSKKYLQHIKDEYFLGDQQEIQGRIYKLYPRSKIVTIRMEEGRAVSIFLSEEDFYKIRYHRESSPLFLFRGRPRYRLGVETPIISEFEADEIEYIRSEKSI